MTGTPANEPGTSFETGVFSRLTDRALDLFLSAYAVPSA